MKKYEVVTFLVIFFFACLNLNAQGWEKSYLDTTGSGMGRCAIQTMDGGFYFTSDPAHIGVGQTAKLDAYGNVIWSTVIGGSSLTESADSGCVIASTHYSSFEFRKLNFFGIQLWSKMYAFGGQHYIQYIDKVSDGGFIACGGADSNGIVLKLNVDGDTVWTYTSSNSNWDIFEEVVETYDHGFVAIDRIGSSSLRIIKLNSNGNLVWSKFYPAMWSETICQAADSGFVISRGLAGVSKLDSLGNLMSTKSVGANSRIYSIKKTFDNGYILAGQVANSSSDYDLLLVKLDDSCNTQWSKTFYNGPYIDYAESVNLLSDGGYVVCGSINFTSTNVSSYVIRTDSLGNSTVGLGELFGVNENDISIQPNPFQTETVLKFNEVRNAVLSVYNYLGENIFQIDKINGTSFRMSRNNISSGLYLIKLTVNNKVISTGKLIIID